MRVVVDERRLASRRRLARRLSLAGLVVLGFGLFVSLTAEPTRPMVVLSYGALIAGTMASWSGVALMNRWVAPPRPELVIPAALAGLGPPFALYHFALPAEHVLVAPWGLVVLHVLDHRGAAAIRGSRWRDRRPLLARLLAFGRRPLRDPTRLVGWEVQALQRAIAEREPALGDVPIEAVAVFVHPSAMLDAEEPSLPAVVLGDLKAWLRARGKGRRLPPADVRRLTAVLDGLASDGA